MTMPEKPKISIVIPVYNEAGVIEQTHVTIAAVLDSLPYDISVYYVDDGSTDEPWKRWKSLLDRISAFAPCI